MRRRRREQLRFSVAVAILSAIAAWACLAVAAWGGITVPSKIEDHKPIVAVVSVDDVPDGAKMRGSFTSTTAMIEPGPQPGVYHLWAPPGKHVLVALGIWVLTKDVTVGTETFPVLIDFGQYQYSAVIEVLGGDPGPVPPPPPPPSDKYQIVMFYQADQLDNYPAAQRSLLISLALRQKLVSQGHQVLEILEEAAIGTSGGSLAEFTKSVQGDSLPRLAIRPVSGGPVSDYPLPADEAGLMTILEGK